MKKVLLGTSALIAAVAVSAPAMAQEQIQLGIGGKMEQYFGVVDMDEQGDNAATAAIDESEDRSTTGIDTDVEVYFTGATTLDNGLTVGAVIQLEAEVNDGTTDTDEQYAYIEGAFGRLEAGERNGVLSQLAHIAPAVGLGQGDIDDWTRDFANTGNTSTIDTTVSSDIPVVTYITPTLAGFSAGVSYQPGAGARTINENTTAHDRWQASIAYNGEFSGVGIGADVAYLTQDNADRTTTTTSATTVTIPAGVVLPAVLTPVTTTTTTTAATNDDDYEVWRGGLVLAYAGFQFGGSYMAIDGVGGTDNEDRVWDLGVAYETGPYGVSLTYANAERETYNTAGVGRAQQTEAEYQQLSLHGSYTMGPGINLVGGAFWADEEVDVIGSTVADTDADGYGAVVGLALSF